MRRSYRDNKPRFHKHRQGKMLLPHNQLAGLFFTVNPRQEPRAQREAQLYLSTITADLEAAHEAFVNSEHITDTSVDTITAPQPSTSLSSLLAEELAACSAQNAHGNRFNAAKRGRANDDDVDDSTVEDGSRKTRHRGDTPQRRSEWFAPLETGCKGYLFLNIPTVNAIVTCPTCHAAPEFTEGEATSAAPTAGNEAPPATEADAVPPHTIVVNPLVSLITERVFEDLADNPRPIFRNCFRLIPAELTCCPTLAEMQTALRKLLSLHFPAELIDTTVAADSQVNFAERIPFPSWGRNMPRRSMHSITLQLTVKNNTTVERKKCAISSALTAAIPANRFIVVTQPSQMATCSVEATVCVFVAHSTCVMGVQRRVNERHGFNLHAVGEDAFVLSDALQVLSKGEQHSTQPTQESP